MPPLALNGTGLHTFEEWLRAPAPLESVHERFDIRRAVCEEFDRIYDLVNEGFGLNRTRSRYDWLYRHNPYGIARCWIALDRTSGQLVASWAAFPWPVARGTQWAEGCQTGDFVVAPEWQRQGLTDLRGRAFRSHAWEAKQLRFSWPNENSRGASSKHGRGVDILGPLPMAVLMLDSRKYLAERQWSALLSVFVGGAIDRAVSAWTTLRLWRESLKVEAVRRFDSSFDEITRRCMSRSGIWSPHDATFLNWRYFENPSSEYVAFALADGNNVEGYYVLKIDGPVSWLMEFAAPVSPQRPASTLLLHLIETARAAGSNRIRFSAPPRWRHWKLLGKAGFIRLPSHIYIKTSLDDEEPERGQLKAWQLVPGDIADL